MRALVALVLLVALAGCAGRVNKGAWMSDLTVSEQAEATRLEQAMIRLEEDCARRYADQRICRQLAPALTIVDNKVNAHYGSQYAAIIIPRRLLIPNPAAHAMLAHELAHAWFSDARNDCQDEAKAFLCEQAANERGVSVLVMGWGYSHQQAVHAMWSYLVASVRSQVTPSWGHPDACKELHAFELWARIPTYNCREQ